MFVIRANRGVCKTLCFGQFYICDDVCVVCLPETEFAGAVFSYLNIRQREFEVDRSVLFNFEADRIAVMLAVNIQRAFQVKMIKL